MPIDFNAIKHLIVLTMENRSFDHMLGSLQIEGRLVNGITSALTCPPNPDRKGNLHRPAALRPHVFTTNFADHRNVDRTSEFDPDPPHDRAAVSRQMRLSDTPGPNLMDGFVRVLHDENPHMNYPEDVLGYYSRDQLPFLYFLADNFTICDRWFCSVPTSTMPNRLYGICGDSAGHDETPVKDINLPLGSIFDDLADTDWAIYCPFKLNQPLTTARFLGETKYGRFKERRKRVVDHCRRLEEFPQAAASGLLPPVTFVDPRFNWLEDGNDDHPPNPIQAGQRLMRKIYAAVSANPVAWAGTVLVITYDEHGGFYDHVPPDPIPEVAKSPTDRYQGWTTYGPRVPTLIVSPLVAAGGVSSTTLEHCSILKLICDWKNLDGSRLSPRVQHAPSMAAVLDTNLRLGPGFPRTPPVPAPIDEVLARTSPPSHADERSSLKAQFDLLK